MTRELIVTLTWWLAVTQGGCPSVERERQGSAPPAHHAHLPGPSQAICDKGYCALFCSRVRDCSAEAECEARCAEVCGDGYFDDRDGPIVACTLGAESDGCSGLRTCCGLDYTSQLCAVGGVAKAVLETPPAPPPPPEPPVSDGDAAGTDGDDDAPAAPAAPAAPTPR